MKCWYTDNQCNCQNFECQRACIVSYRCWISLCGMEFHSCCTWSANAGTFNAGCGWWCWSCRPIMSHMCSIGEKDLVILQAKATYQYSGEHIGLQQQYEGKHYLVANHPFNGVHEWQHNRFHHQTQVHICSQGAWDNHESAFAVIGNCSPDSRCRSNVSRMQTAWLQALTWPPSNQQYSHHWHQGRSGFHQKTQQISTPSSNEL